MTQAETMASQDDVFTDRRLNRTLVERALNVTATEPVPILGHYTALASGGVSGHRGVFVFDSEAMVGYIMSAFRSLKARLVSLGGLPPEGLTIAMVAAASAVHGTRSAAPGWQEALCRCAPFRSLSRCLFAKSSSGSKRCNGHCCTGTRQCLPALRQRNAPSVCVSRQCR
jgi:hypothetical protein